MDLTDTWVAWYSHSKREQKERERNRALFVLNCSLCGSAVPLDDDFDIYSTAPEVIGSEVDDDDRRLPSFLADAPLAAEIVCLACLRFPLPALAQWVTDYRRLRVTRAALIASALKGGA